MNTHFGTIVVCAVSALALKFAGPADANLAPHAIGGVECNASDYIEFDCAELMGHPDMCNNITVAAATVQECKDEYAKEDVVCTENLCDNETKDKLIDDPVDPCTEQGCG